jgi:DNA polymerase III sliding clamp (beta) subunit (PCNA family)
MTIIDRTALLAKLDIAAPALASVGSIPILQNFLFTGEKLVAYNDCIGIAVALPTDFQGAVPGALLHKIIGRLTHAQQIDLTESNQRLAIGAVGYRTAADNPVLPRAPFEQLFKMPARPRSGYAPDAAFFTAVENCLQSVSKYSEVRERLGITFIPERERLLLYATDGGTLAHARLPGHGEFKARCTLPLEFCEQMLRFKDAQEKQLTIAADHVLFAADDVLLFSRLLAVEQPMDYARVLKRFLPNAFPDGMPAPTDKERARMKIAFELAALMTDEVADERTDISISGGKLRLQAANATRGQATDLLWYRAHPDAHCGAVMERVLKGFNRYQNLLIRNDVVLLSSGENVYLVAAMR